MIPPAEYQLALLTIIADAVVISGDDLVIETARLFEFDRTGPDLKEAIDRQVERLVKEGRLHLDENGLRIADSNSGSIIRIDTHPARAKFRRPARARCSKSKVTFSP